MREITIGRSLIDDDIDRGSAVAVIGSDVADAFFANMEPLGKEILIDGHPVRVIGVVEKKGTVFGNSQDNFIWVPISYFQKIYGTRRSVDIMVQARSMENFEAAQDQARVIMRNRRHLGFNKPDDFSVETGESVLELWQNATRGIYVVTVVVTGISLHRGRRGGHEHHARLGDRAYPRDRRADGGGGARAATSSASSSWSR